MDEIIAYLRDDKLHEEKDTARRLKYQAKKYLIYNEKLYRQGNSTPLRCLRPSECLAVLREIHKGVCGNRAGGHSFAYKAFQGVEPTP